MASETRLNLDKQSLFLRLDGDRSRPALLLLHGFPSSSYGFRHVIPRLSEQFFVIAPDMPGFGETDPLPDMGFSAIAALLEAALNHLGVEKHFIYLHDFGAPAGLTLAMKRPDRVLGLVIQNANAHLSGFGPQWHDTRAFWRTPTPENEVTATAHLTASGIRDQYTLGLPPDLTGHTSAETWERDWAFMQRPGRLEAQRALIRDYGRYADDFPRIQDYLREYAPPALLLWGRHDAFFALDEVLSWMEDLPRMEAHIFDGGHFLLETHGHSAAELINAFGRRCLAGDPDSAWGEDLRGD
ncbi:MULTISPECIES: alpha/beta fold hydrolase [Asticcacaulis]|uniref:alpha/beta fold hydrolase n=1 Tax=Asticcacaulis TaxID=76890 RepID=UPI001AEA2612|nr:MULTISPECIES: alpha/beta fold hydrolase [Asticcacaulis]MBP2158517.1 pimeloyl-ACP methyl ester carboxylesterase [Asticcacaulis solisilvae]MDR6799563.1 pimeloyl-ACP methyl ester carboxylesterase [Asticcacaulis sp. BE141]